MNTIDSYQFGEIVINDKKYSSDVLIFPDRVINNQLSHSQRLVAALHLTR
ncbi:hypothetical protein ACFLTO_03290 [Chloroflexota bacterium]